MIWIAARRLFGIISSAVLLGAPCRAKAPHATAGASRPSSRAAAYFIQDNLVNSRLLDLEPDGSYRQIDVDRSSAAETDRGTWEPDAAGAVLLHSTLDGLRFRALISGPLTIVLDRPGVLGSLSVLANGIRDFLAASEDEVFARHGIAEMNTALLAAGAPAMALSMDPNVETFSRGDLISLAHQLDDLTWSRRTNTTILTPVAKTSPSLLVLQDARFQAADLARVEREYRVKPGDAPPFYFAQVDAKVFAHRAGRWKVLRLPGIPN